MEIQKVYMVIDIGTGNVRVATTKLDGSLIHVERDNVHYQKDIQYEDALSFSPDKLWSQILVLAKKVLAHTPKNEVLAITVSSQREGIVLIDKDGNSLLGMPNHDHRGKAFENIVADPSAVYKLTGRYPSSLFSAMKLVGIKNKQPEIYEQIDVVMSISDWAQYKLSGITAYEHAQASETQLYDVAKREWSPDLCAVFGIDAAILPPLRDSGTILGKILPELSEQLNLNTNAVIIVGGADTQLAIKSTQPAIGDVVMVSGTTTPIAMIIEDYLVDEKQKTWTGSHVNQHQFILEANAGVTGLNYQRLKEIFYPNEGYEVIEKELSENQQQDCIASLGSLVADEEGKSNKGGFIFSTPVSHELTRACFAKAALWDIACAIKSNFDTLCRVHPYQKDYVWACGGGFQSKLLCTYVAGLINKTIYLRKNNTQASVIGGALICSAALGNELEIVHETLKVAPQHQQEYEVQFQKWKAVRLGLKEVFKND